MFLRISSLLGSGDLAEAAAGFADRVGAKQEDRQQRRERADAQPVLDLVRMASAGGDGGTRPMRRIASMLARISSMAALPWPLRTISSAFVASPAA